MKFPIGSRVRITKPNLFTGEPADELEVVEVVWAISLQNGLPAFLVSADRLELIEPEAPEEG